MKIEVTDYLSGEVKLQVIAETPAETEILKSAWRRNHLPMGNGDSTTYNGGKVGFYIPLFDQPAKP